MYNNDSDTDIIDSINKKCRTSNDKENIPILPSINNKDKIVDNIHPLKKG